jgi:hypothetical protein
MTENKVARPGIVRRLVLGAALTSLAAVGAIVATASPASASGVAFTDHCYSSSSVYDFYTTKVDAHTFEIFAMPKALGCTPTKAVDIITFQTTSSTEYHITVQCVHEAGYVTPSVYFHSWGLAGKGEFTVDQIAPGGQAPTIKDEPIKDLTDNWWMYVTGSPGSLNSPAFAFPTPL